MINRLKTVVARRFETQALLQNPELSRPERVSLKKELRFYTKEAQRLVGVAMNAGHSNKEIQHAVNTQAVASTR